MMKRMTVKTLRVGGVIMVFVDGFLVRGVIGSVGLRVRQ